MIRILIADDHAIVRRGLKQIVAQEADMAVLGEAENGHQVMQFIRAKDWDVLVLDINMPGRGGLDVLSEVRQIRPRLPVLILSVHPEEQYAVRILKSGAAGYLNKETAPEVLVQAIRKVHGGGRYVSAALAEKLASDLGSPAEHLPHENLADREFQVLCLIGKGKTVSAIAEELCLSVKTVSTYRTRLLEKMRLKTNAELMQYAIRHKLVD